MLMLRSWIARPLRRRALVGSVLLATVSLALVLLVVHEANEDVLPSALAACATLAAAGAAITRLRPRTAPPRRWPSVARQVVRAPTRARPSVANPAYSYYLRL